MSNRTSQALADAWLNADIALTRKTRKEEMSNLEMGYKELTQSIADNQAQMVRDRADAATLGGNIFGALKLAHGLYTDPFTLASFGLNLAEAAGFAAIGAQVGEAVYDTGVLSSGQRDMLAEIGEAKEDIAGYDWALSEQARKYESDVAEEFSGKGQYQGQTDIAAYDAWADDFWQTGYESIADIGTAGLGYYTATGGFDKPAGG